MTDFDWVKTKILTNNRLLFKDQDNYHAEFKAQTRQIHFLSRDRLNYRRIVFTKPWTVFEPLSWPTGLGFLVNHVEWWLEFRNVWLIGSLPNRSALQSTSKHLHRASSYIPLPFGGLISLVPPFNKHSIEYTYWSDFIFADSDCNVFKGVVIYDSTKFHLLSLMN
ncbi:hypothetical protein EYC80_010141 [Monilinia laxa]|uniref:Uncharacterized protein n=1 Tax=Monilinia laxa TaxID=61186 RepID=A0A5N6JPP4_MONLA|nr:hypothetical protein EYC80_010141 [Monilinia laxa]